MSSLYVDFFKELSNLKATGTPMSHAMVDIAVADPLKSILVACANRSRWPEAEPYIIDNIIRYGKCDIVGYCTSAIGGRWDAFEDTVLNRKCHVDPQQMICDYSRGVIKGRWREAEGLLTDPLFVVDYCSNVIRGRWHEKEPLILNNISAILNYCHLVIHSRWEEAEKVIIESRNPESIIDYSNSVINGRWKEAEKNFPNSPKHIVRYALEIIKGRWLEKESTIAKDPYYAFHYAKEIIHGPFPEAEKAILESDCYFEYFTFATSSLKSLASQLSSRFPPNMTVSNVLDIINNGRNIGFEKKLLSSKRNQEKAVWYAKNVLKSRWPDAEEDIKKSAKWAVVYARDVIGGRWEEAEKFIYKNDKYLAQYGVEVIKGKLPTVLHNNLMASVICCKKNNKEIKSYFEMLEKCEKK